jgi:hypothetical protein
MVKFYDDVDPEMADMTNEKLMVSLPHCGYWTVKKPLSPINIFPF